MKQPVTMHYKGYTATVEWREEDGCYDGEVAGIDHILEVRGATPDEAYRDFTDLIDDYPATCADLGMKPCPPPSPAKSRPLKVPPEKLLKGGHRQTGKRRVAEQ